LNACLSLGSESLKHAYFQLDPATATQPMNNSSNDMPENVQPNRKIEEKDKTDKSDKPSRRREKQVGTKQSETDSLTTGSLLSSLPPQHSKAVVVANMPSHHSDIAEEVITPFTHVRAQAIAYTGTHPRANVLNETGLR
jgi:hypothetical protein